MLVMYRERERTNGFIVISQVMNSPTEPLDRSEKEKSENEVIKVRTYLATFSPKEDLEEELIKALKKHAEKHLYAYAVIERGHSGKKHLHMCLCGHVAKELKHWREPFAKLMKKYHPSCYMKKALVTTTQYNHKWYDEYLLKEVDREVLYDNYNRELVGTHFPPQEIQDRLQAIRATSNLGDKFYSGHEERWIEHSADDASYESACEYFQYRMYVQRDMTVIADKRRLGTMAWALYEYRNRIVKPCVELLNHGARMSGNILH